MLIEQIIEFEVRGLGPTGRTYAPTAGYFHDNTKISKEYLQVDYFYYLLLKYCMWQCALLPKSLTKFNRKFKILKVLWA